MLRVYISGPITGTQDAEKSKGCKLAVNFALKKKIGVFYEKDGMPR